MGILYCKSNTSKEIEKAIAKNNEVLNEKLDSIEDHIQGIEGDVKITLCDVKTCKKSLADSMFALSELQSRLTTLKWLSIAGISASTISIIIQLAVWILINE